MARKSEVDRTRQHLMMGAQALRGSLPDVADTLEALAKPFGHRMLTVDRTASRVPEGAVNVSLLAPKELRTAIQEAAVDAAASDDVKVQDLLSRVLEARIPQVLSGELVPREIPREPRGAGVEKVNLNVPVDGVVLQQLRDALPDLGKRLGYRNQATVAKILFRLLLDEYGLDYQVTQGSSLSLVQLYVPPQLGAAIRRKVEASGEELKQLLTEGYTKLLAGSWQPYEIPKARPGSEYERDRLSAYVDGALVERVRVRARQLKSELGYRVTPQTIAIDYLVSEFGLEELADAEYAAG